MVAVEGRETVRVSNDQCGPLLGAGLVGEFPGMSISVHPDANRYFAKLLLGVMPKCMADDAPVGRHTQL